MAVTKAIAVEWAILGVGSSSSPFTRTIPVEWAILATDPVPSGALIKTQTVAWRIWGTDTLELVLTGAPTGQTGIMTVSIETNDEHRSVVYPPSAQQVIEQPAGSGRYVATVPNPGLGSYFVVWSDGTSQAVAALLILPGGIGVGVFLNRTPPARTDGMPWSTVQVMEGATRLGPYLLIESFPLSPLDVDAADPVARDITTVQATLTAGWYGLAWTDDAGHQSMTDPEYSTNVLATVT